MASTRTYGEACAAAHALDLVGERWALLVVRELMLGPKRFTDLRSGIVHASPNVLSQRLRELEETGVIRRRTLPPPVSARVYELTEWGRELEPALVALGRFGARSPFRVPDAGMSVDSHVLALGAMFEPELAGDLQATVQLRLGEDRFRIGISGGLLTHVRGEAPRPDAVIDTDPATLASLVWMGLPLTQAERSGEVKVEGDRKLVKRFLGLFPLPPVAEPAEQH